MRQILAELDHRDDGTFTVARLTDENTNDITYRSSPASASPRRPNWRPCWQANWAARSRSRRTDATRPAMPRWSL